MSKPKYEFLLKDLLHAVYWFDESLQISLEDAGLPRISRTKSMILINVADNVTRPIQIAANLGVSRQAVHLALKELEAEGLVLLEPDPNDQRAICVSISLDPRGDKIRNAANDTLQGIEKVLEKRLGRNLYRQLQKALRSDWQKPVSLSLGDPDKFCLPPRK